MATLRNTTIIDCAIHGDFLTYDANIHLGAEQAEHITLGVEGRVLRVLDEQEMNRATIEVGDLDVGGNTNLTTDKIREGLSNRYFDESRVANALESAPGISWTYDETRKKIRPIVTDDQSSESGTGNIENFPYAHNLTQGSPVELAYNEATNRIEAFKLDIDTENANLNFDPSVTFSSVDLVVVEMLNPLFGIILYQVGSINGRLALRSFSVDGTTGEITLNTEVMTDLYTSAEYNITAIDRERFLIAVSRKQLVAGIPTTIEDNVLIIGSVNEFGNITLGTEYVLADSRVSVGADILNENGILAAYRKKNGQGEISYCTFDATTITHVASTRLTNSTPDKLTVRKIDSGHVVITYADLSLNGKGVFQIVGYDTVTQSFSVGTATIFASNDLTQSVFGYGVISTSTNVFTCLVVQGTDLTYRRYRRAVGTQANNIDSGTYSYGEIITLIKAAKLTESVLGIVAVTYDPVDLRYTLVVQLTDLDGDKLSFRPEVYPQLITSNKPIYIDVAASNDLYIVTHDYATSISELFRGRFVNQDSRGKFAGFASEDGLAGETHPIQMLYSSTNIFKDLSPNAVYYLDRNLNLTLEPVGPIVGRSISPNRMIIVKEGK